MNQWISVNDKLPEHCQQVLCHSNKKNHIICNYLDGEKLHQQLSIAGLRVDNRQEKMSSFFSAEIKGFIVDNVTHWMDLPPLPPI